MRAKAARKNGRGIGRGSIGANKGKPIPGGCYIIQNLSFGRAEELSEDERVRSGCRGKSNKFSPPQSTSISPPNAVPSSATHLLVPSLSHLHPPRRRLPQHPAHDMVSPLWIASTEGDLAQVELILKEASVIDIEIKGPCPIGLVVLRTMYLTLFAFTCAFLPSIFFICDASWRTQTRLAHPLSFRP